LVRQLGLEQGPAVDERVTLIGFGEAGRAFAGSKAWRGRASAYDRLTDDPASAAGIQAEYRLHGVAGADSLSAALKGSALALSLVNAEQALAVARASATHIAPGTSFCDMNSVAPGTKRQAAEAIEAAGGHYVDVAIMSPVNPARLSVPLLLSGAEAGSAERRLAGLGFTDVRVVGDRVGQASSIKMIRSVIVKGIEALTAECMLAAFQAGVAEEVLASLDASDKGISWTKRADYNLDRMMVHGIRRAEEMDEVARTLEDLGVEPAMTRGTISRQRQIGQLGLKRPAVGLAGKIRQIEEGRAAAS
jgi:3-hydroxyisobutyrate dehydrogenase-like beta-hydroxyacid dehydrogenase